MNTDLEPGLQWSMRSGPSNVAPFWVGTEFWAKISNIEPTKELGKST